MRGIDFKLTLKGQGCVNFDSIENQSFILGKIHKRKFENNSLVMKKSFYKDKGEESGYVQIPKIGSNKLRYYIFGKQMTPYDAVNKDMAMRVFSKWESIARGGALILKKKSEEYNLHKKGGFNITDALLTNNAVPQFEIQTSNVVDPTTGKRASTSMFNVETLGETVWESNGRMDIFDLQFLSASKNNDRMYLFPDWVSSGEFQEFLKMEFGEISNPNTGYFYANRETSHPEYGILLNDEIVERIIKNTLINMLRINAHSRNGYIETDSLKVRIYDDITSLDEKNEGWIDIRSIDDIEKLDFSNIHCFYKKADDDVIEDYLKNVDKMKEDILAANKNEDEDLSVAEGS